VTGAHLTIRGRTTTGGPRGPKRLLAAPVTQMRDYKAPLRKTGDPSRPMQLIADFFPLILFFLAYKLQGIMVATAVAIAASIAQIAWFKWKGKVSPVHWLSLAIIVVFGGATLILKDELFIKWKPTVLYGAFCAILVGGKPAFRRDLLASVL